MCVYIMHIYVYRKYIFINCFRMKFTWSSRVIQHGGAVPYKLYMYNVYVYNVMIDSME